MKLLFTVLAMIIVSANESVAQNVGIGTTTPNASALLELQSTNKGLLLPRVADTFSVSSPAKGLLVYANASNKMWFYDGSRWQQATGAGGTDANWQLQGDSLLYTNKKYVSINTDKAVFPPVEGLQATGNLMIQEPVTYTSSQPTAGQTITMNNTGSLQFISNTDSTGRIFDPAGAGINYFNNMQGNIYIDLSQGVNFSFNTNDFGLASGDTLWFSLLSFPACRDNYYYRFTNTSSTPPGFNISKVSGGSLYIIFRSNGDNVNNKGFDITWKRMYIASQASTTVPAGNALVFNGNSGSIRAGGSFRGTIGAYSTSMGFSNTASGNSSGAMGSSNTASGNYSIAMGLSNTASSQSSVAMGWENTANGNTSVAMGIYNTASGGYSVTMGERNTANSTSSVAMGRSNIANGYASVAMGYFNIASGNNSVAMGNSTDATGVYTTAIGSQITARSYNSIVFGQYNDSIASSNPTSWVPTDPLLILGNGSSFFNRSNALLIYKNGNMDINGFTCLGELSNGAPRIKTKKLSGNSANAQGGVALINHGLTRSKILGVQVLLTYDAASGEIPGTYLDVPGFEYNWQVTGSTINIYNKNGNSANILNKPIKILITYEE